MSDKRIVFGTVGIGGYAAGIINMLRAASQGPVLDHESPVDFIACSEIDHTLHAEKIAELRTAGIRVHEKFDDLLAEPIQALWLPLPIDLHRPFTEKALAAGKAVICEKPAAGSVQDVDAMIAARDRHKLPVAIGFQDVYCPTTMPAKRALLGGGIGKVLSASVHGVWPRNATYYGRANWAGAFKRNGVWVMDSPANNAMAHYINIALFLLGQAEADSADIEAVEAELYRVNPIENYDTISARLHLKGGVPLMVNLTHAGDEITNPVIQIQGERGTLIRTPQHVVILAAGDTQVLTRPPGNEGTRRILLRFCGLLKDEPFPDTAYASLEVARAHAVAISGASEAAEVVTVPEQYWNTIDYASAPLRAIPGIERAFEVCSRKHQLLSETGIYPWTVKPGQKDLRGYTHFAGPKLG